MSSTGRTGGQHGWRIAQVGGVPVFLGRSWVVVAVVIMLLFGPVVAQVVPGLGGVGAYLVAGLFALLLLLSVLVHEAAHAVVATRVGHRVDRVVADFWGGHTAYDAATATPGGGALVAAAGPLANAALALLGWLLTPVLPGGVAALLGLGFTFANGFVAVFNLLPGLPLDGGYLVESLVWRLTGSRGTGTFVAGWSGRVLIVLLVVWAVGLPLLQEQGVPWTRLLWVGLIGAFLWAGAGEAVRVGSARRVFEATTVGSVLRPAALLRADAPVSAVPAAGPPLVVVDDGALLGVVDPDAVVRVPADHRAGTPVLAVVHRRPPGWVVRAEPGDDVTDLVVAMQRSGTPVVAVVDGTGRFLGLVHAGDV